MDRVYHTAVDLYHFETNHNMKHSITVLKRLSHAPLNHPHLRMSQPTYEFSSARRVTGPTRF